MTDSNPIVDALLASGRRELTTTPTEDTAVIDTDEPQPPIPAEGAPHAYVAVCRNPAAKHAAWWQDAVVIPAQSTEEQHYYTRQGYELLPIGPDGDTGTRAITDQDARITALHAAVAGITEDRDALRNELFVAETKLRRPTVADLPEGWRPPARKIATVDEMDTLPFRSLVRVQAHSGYDVVWRATKSRGWWWCADTDEGAYAEELLKIGAVTVLWTPAEVAS